MDEESRKAIERGEEAQNLANDLLASVDEEIKSLEAQVEQYRKQVEALQAENNGLRAKMNGLTSMPLLYMGDEKDLYDGEIKDIILSVLLEAMGMEITEDGIHYKVKYYGDDRYYTSIAKSASDHREGDNIAHHIIKGML